MTNPHHNPNPGAYRTTRRQTNSRSVNSLISQLADS